MMNFKHLETTFEEIEVEDLEKVKGGSPLSGWLKIINRSFKGALGRNDWG
ncbi:ComC/BlpC family leader-containing pheromone/bacteriocin [Streptococcus ferus]